MGVYTIQARHEVEVTYRVEADGPDEAIRTLCDKELFTEFCGSPPTFGPDEGVMEANGIELVEVDCYSDPSPTGRQRVEREWEILLCDEEEEEKE